MSRVVSSYTVAQFKSQKTQPNEDQQNNELNRLSYRRRSKYFNKNG